MYHSTGVQKLSPSQMSKLRNGHSVRIKQGSGNTLHLTDAQIKKLVKHIKKEQPIRYKCTQNKRKSMERVSLAI